MKVSSPAFADNELIPKQYTCEGPNMNPPLLFEDVPEGTKSFVLIVEDPDAPNGTWVHWLVYDIPPTSMGVKENSLPQGGMEGLANGGTKGYEGPCPPSGTHRYTFQLYALDTILQTAEVPDTKKVRELMERHILDKAELVGIYHEAKRLIPLP